MGGLRPHDGHGAVALRPQYGRGAVAFGTVQQSPSLGLLLLAPLPTSAFRRFSCFALLVPAQLPVDSLG